MDIANTPLTSSALQLPIVERIRLAELLAESVDKELAAEEAYDAFWREEALRRIQAFRAGTLTDVDAEEALDNVLAALDK